ncbi:MAG: AzlC family ABC transporter permease [Cellulosilyticaceae bacterium]
MQGTNLFTRGMKKAMPIALGYFPVSFTFGIMATAGGIHPLMATLISLTNFTSAGQFAGTQLLLQQGMLVEIAITTFVINIRYMLMSLAISQKIEKMKIGKKLLLAFGITDETFALAMLQSDKVSFEELAGMMVGPYVGWSVGTLSGAYLSTLLSTDLQNAMGIALYAMFIALLVPEVKKSIAICKVTLLTIIVSLMFAYVPILCTMTSGWKIILTTLIGSTLGAYYLPISKEAYT